MTKDLKTSRRSFLKSGAMIAAPLVVAMPAAAIAGGTREGAGADEQAIARLRERWLDHVNSGAHAEAQAMLTGRSACRIDENICGIAADYRAEAGTLTIAGDGRSALQRVHCTVDMETAIEKDCTLALMAHAQGTGQVRHQETRLLILAFARADAGWVIEDARLTAV
ncbi:MAG TPA: hypothetical protein VNS79_03150 [Sphingobium sp.]|nr:hypothetical protein [Sphingobium sp.]